MGLDKTQVTSGLKIAQQNVADFAQGTKDSLKDVKAGLKDIKLLMIGFMLIDKMDEWIKKTKEVSSFWGTYTAGGMAALNLEQRLNGEIEVRKQKLAQLKKDMIEFESEQKTLQKEILEDQLKSADQTRKVSLLRKEDTDTTNRMVELLKKRSTLEFEIANLHKNGRDTLDKDVALSRVIIDLTKAEMDLIKSQNALKKEDLKLSQEKDEITKRIADRDAALAKQQLDSMKKTIDARTAFLSAAKSLGEAKDSRVKLSLEDLANMDARQFRRGSDARADVLDAQEVMNLEAEAKNPAYDLDYRNSLSERALELRKGITNLRDTDKNPLKTLEEAAHTTAKTLEKFENEGIPVRD